VEEKSAAGFILTFGEALPHRHLGIDKFLIEPGIAG